MTIDDGKTAIRGKAASYLRTYLLIFVPSYHFLKYNTNMVRVRVYYDPWYG